MPTRFSVFRILIMVRISFLKAAGFFFFFFLGSLLKEGFDRRIVMEVVAQCPFAACIASLFKEREQLGTEGIDRMNVFRKLLQM